MMSGSDWKGCGRPGASSGSSIAAAGQSVWFGKTGAVSLLVSSVRSCLLEVQRVVANLGVWGGKGIAVSSGAPQMEGWRGGGAEDRQPI